MTLAGILGSCILLSWPSANMTPLVPAMVFRPWTQSQDSPPSNSSPQGAAPLPPTNQQQAPDKPVTPPPRPAATSQPCPENSQPGSSTKSDCKPAASTGTKPKKHHHKTIAPAATPARSGPQKTVVRNGGTSDPTVDLSPGLSPQQTSRQMASTNQLLATSDANLKKVSGRQLTANQQDTVKQIKSYMDQAKAAEKGGDAQRAYNLAVKANLLSAELVGH
jgi:hypothetical protein